MEGRLNLFCLCLCACMCVCVTMAPTKQDIKHELIRSLMMLATVSHKYYCEITQNIPS